MQIEWPPVSFNPEDFNPQNILDSYFDVGIVVSQWDVLLQGTLVTISLALLAACSTPGTPSMTGDAPASKATSTARPSEPAPAALAQGASAPSVSAAASEAAKITKKPSVTKPICAIDE